MDEVQLEHRLMELRAEMALGFGEMRAELRTATIEVAGMKQQLAKQNGRIRVLEEWVQERRLQLARAAGVVEGRTGLTRTQLAVLGVLMPASFAVLDLGLRLLVAIT